MSEERIASFEEFWPFYVREHSKRANRVLHFVGTSSAMACLAGALLLGKRRLLALAPLVGYGPAWVGHFFVEKNRPASFSYPLWSLRADLKMWAMTVAGAMDAEVERVMAEASVAAGADAAAGDGLGRVDAGPREANGTSNDDAPGRETLN